MGDFMAIQTINLTVPGGDTPRSANTKINANFTDKTNAASKLVGNTKGAIPLAESVLQTTLSSIGLGAQIVSTPEGEGFIDNLMAGAQLISRSLLPSAVTRHASDSVFFVTTKELSQSTSRRLQTFIGIDTGCSFFRICDHKDVWTAVESSTTNPTHYGATTASGANVFTDASGRLLRSTSSERYKDILAPLELDDARYDDAMALKPIVYRSTADADNPAYHYYSFSAEELGAYDPAFTLWRETETVADADGNVSEQPLAERQAEGININALLAVSHAIAIKQDSLIKALQAQVGNLQSAVATLQATNNP